VKYSAEHTTKTGRVEY